MKLVKRLVVAVALIALAVPVIAQIRFPDVPDDHPRAVAIRWAAEQEFYKGFPDGSFRPDDELTESQFIKTARRLYERYDSWTRADWAQVLYAGVPSLQTTPAATTTTTTTRPATTTTLPAPITTRESIRYYTDLGDYYAARANAHLTGNKAWAIVAYRLAGAAYHIACGNIRGLGFGFTYHYPGGLDGAIADGFTDNPKIAAYVASVGICEAARTYRFASYAAITPLRYTDYGFGNAIHAHELVALATEHAAAALAALAAYDALGAPEPDPGSATALSRDHYAARYRGRHYFGGLVEAYYAASDATEFAAGRPSDIPPSAWTAPGQTDAVADAAAIEYAVEYSAAAAELAAVAARAAETSRAEHYASAGLRAALSTASYYKPPHYDFDDADADAITDLATEYAEYAEYAAAEAALVVAAHDADAYAAAEEAVVAKFAEYADADVITDLAAKIFNSRPDSADAITANEAKGAAITAAGYDHYNREIAARAADAAADAAAAAAYGTDEYDNWIPWYERPCTYCDE